MTASNKQAEPLAGSGARLVLPGLAMIAVVYGLARFSYGLFLPQFRATFDLNTTLLGLIAGGSYAGYCVAIMLSSALSPRLGPRAVVVLAGVVAAAGMCLVATASGGAALAAGVLIAGMSTGRRPRRWGTPSGAGSPNTGRVQPTPGSTQGRAWVCWCPARWYCWRARTGELPGWPSPPPRCWSPAGAH